MAPAWRVAKSLLKLRDQVNNHYPKRGKGSDGTIGDAAHRSRSSDHNPWIRDGNQGVVTALDLTHDPRNGFDSHAFAEHLRVTRDPRVKYCISNRRIFSSVTSPWQWRKYSGSNPHIAHMHVSVLSAKSHYDNERPWTLPRSGKEAPLPSAEAEVDVPIEQTTDMPANRPTVRRGDRSEYVRIIQRLLLLPADGIFGDTTFAAVRAFQRGADLTSDGMVGPDTWAALDEIEQEPGEQRWQRDIVATVFGGKRDPNRSAYAERFITDAELGVALPFRFTGDRPQVVVQNAATGKQVVCEIVDVGPWNTQDEYWSGDKRPQAETGSDTRGRKTNRAGIDLTPAAARAIGLPGLGKVHWAFVTTQDEGEAG